MFKRTVVGSRRARGKDTAFSNFELTESFESVTPLSFPPLQRNARFSQDIFLSTCFPVSLVKPGNTQVSYDALSIVTNLSDFKQRDRIPHASRRQKRNERHLVCHVRNKTCHPTPLIPSSPPLPLPNVPRRVPRPSLQRRAKCESAGGYASQGHRGISLLRRPCATQEGREMLLRGKEDRN